MKTLVVVLVVLMGCGIVHASPLNGTLTGFGEEFTYTTTAVPGGTELKATVSGGQKITFIDAYSVINGNGNRQEFQAHFVVNSTLTPEIGSTYQSDLIDQDGWTFTKTIESLGSLDGNNVPTESASVTFLVNDPFVVDGIDVVTPYTYDFDGVTYIYGDFTWYGAANPDYIDGGGIPEPATLTTLCVGVLALAARRRK